MRAVYVFYNQGMKHGPGIESSFQWGTNKTREVALDSHFINFIRRYIIGFVIMNRCRKNWLNGIFHLLMEFNYVLFKK